MIRREIVDDYRRLNSDDRTMFRRWLLTNTIVGAVCVMALIAITSIYSGGGSQSAQSGNVVHAEAK